MISKEETHWEEKLAEHLGGPSPQEALLRVGLSVTILRVRHEAVAGMVGALKAVVQQLEGTLAQMDTELEGMQAALSHWATEVIGPKQED